MQRYFKVKTDYKHSEGKHPYQLISVASKWKLPLALTILAFALFLKLGYWFDPVHPQPEAPDWALHHQVTLDVPLPKADDLAPELPLDVKKIEDETWTQPKWQTFTIKAGDNLAQYFQQAGIEPKILQEVLSLRESNHLKKIYPGQILRIQTDSDAKFNALEFDVDPLTTLHIKPHNGNLIGKIQAKPIEKRIAFGGSRIFDSFFVAGKHANLDDALIMELANVFAYDIDFAQDIKPNDHFKVLFEEYFVNGVKVGNGPIVAAEFVNNGKRFQAVRYVDASGKSSYYTPNGQSLKKAFIRTPVQYTRISSHFNLRRRHPVLHHIRAHRGVDYAAPTGTPVKAAGQGKVVFVGKKGGYGNAIILQHGPKYTTLYGHLSRFAKHLKNGQSISQGQIIGYVGSTGLASGPHLHYEFRIDGVHHNPLTVALPQAEGISGTSKKAFLAYTNELLKIMDAQEKVLVAANEF